MLAGSNSDRIRYEQAFRANAAKYREAGDITSMTEWKNQVNKPLGAGVPLIFFRKRMNNDGTYEILDVRPDANSGLYYAKKVTLNVNEESFEKHKEILKDSLFDSATAISDLMSFFDDIAEDAGFMYLQDLLYLYPDDTFEGVTAKGAVAKEWKDCLCTEAELRDFADKLSIDVDFVIPEHIFHHFEDEHNNEFM